MAHHQPRTSKHATLHEDSRCEADLGGIGSRGEEDAVLSFFSLNSEGNKPEVTPEAGPRLTDKGKNMNVDGTGP